MKALKSLMVTALAQAPPRFLDYLERGAQLAQGKGWGADTVKQEVRACLRLCRADVSRSFTIFDIGANVGDWSAEMLRQAPNAAVWAFEPSEQAFAALSERLAGNPRFTPVKIAVARDDGEVQLWAPESGSVLASLTRRRLDHFDIEFAYSETVQTTSLDAWVQREGVHPTIIKLDVEGQEFEVLLGASEALKEVRVVQFEVGGTNIDSRTYFQDFFYFFKHAGFQLFRLTPRGLVRMETYRETDEVFRTTNYFASRTS